MSIKIEVEVPSLDPDEVRQAVQEAAVERLLTTAYLDEDGDVFRTGSTVERDLRKAIGEVVREEAQKLGPPMVEKILAGEVLPVDQYGYRSSAPPTSVAEIIEKEVKKTLASNRDGTSQLHKLIEAEVTRQIAKHLQTITKEALEPLREALKGQMAGAITLALKGAEAAAAEKEKTARQAIYEAEHPRR